MKFMAGLTRFASYFCIYACGWLLGSKGAEAGVGPLVWLFGGVVLASVARSLTEIGEYDRRQL